MNHLVIEHRSASEIAAVGEVDAASVEALRESVAGLGPDVRLDLSACTFIDSSGISFLVEMWHAARDRRGTFTLVAPSPPVAQLLAICGLVESFTIEWRSTAAC